MWVFYNGMCPLASAQASAQRRVFPSPNQVFISLSAILCHKCQQKSVLVCASLGFSPILPAIPLYAFGILSWEWT